MLFFLACAGGGGDVESGGIAETAAGDTGTRAEAAVEGATWSLDDDIGSLGIVTWEQTEDADLAWVEVELGDGEWRAGPAGAATAGEQRSWVAGIPYGAELRARVVNDFGSGAVYAPEFDGWTDALPEGVPEPVVTTTLEAELDPGVGWVLIGLTSADDQAWKLIVDREGRVVWAHGSGGTTGSMQVSRDGAEIVWDDSAEGQYVHRMTLDGEVSETVELVGYHHSFIEVADRALVFVANLEGRQLLRERGDDESFREIFDCTAHWEAHGATIPCDGNTVYWSEADDTLLYSSDNENTVVHLDRATGEPLAWFGQLEGGWAFGPGSSTFWKQHSPLWTPEGRLMVSSWSTADDHTLVAREYELDADARTLTEVWSCDASSGILTEHGGETRRLEGGNTLLNYGPGATVREYTPECAMAWELAWPADTSLRRVTVLDDLYGLLP